MNEVGEGSNVNERVCERGTCGERPNAERTQSERNDPENEREGGLLCGTVEQNEYPREREGGPDLLGMNENE